MVVDTKTTLNWLKRVVREFHMDDVETDIPFKFAGWRDQVQARLAPYHARLLNDYSIEFDSEEQYTLWLIRENHEVSK